MHARTKRGEQFVCVCVGGGGGGGECECEQGGCASV